MRVPSFPALLATALTRLFLFTASHAEETAPPEIRILPDLSYKTGALLTEYEKERCKLDLYLPATGNGFPALVWLHGGGLTNGSKNEDYTVEIAKRFARAGIATAVVNYRLSPKVIYPAYLEDAAAAFVWVRTHAAEQHINPKRIFVGGHSAGGYLTAMLGLDPRWLATYGSNPSAIAGLIPISGQMMTHYTVREERGIKNHNIVIADEAAPINHLHKDTPPLLILFADHDMPARREENLYFIAALRAAGNTRERHLQIDGRTHGSIARNIVNPGDPAAEAIIRFITAPVSSPQN